MVDFPKKRDPYAKAAWGGLALSIGAVALLSIAAWGVRANWWHFTQGLDVAHWAVYVAAAALAVSIWGLIAAARPGTGRAGFEPALLGAVLALPLVGMGAHFEYAAYAYPPINDITTDPDDPLTFWEVPNPEIYPGGETAELQRAHYPDIAPLHTPAAPDTVFREAEALANDRDWDVISAFDGELEGIATTPLFGFEDYVKVQVEPADNGARVDMRSYSRLGQIDRGVNAKRVRHYLEDLAERLEN